MTPLVLGLALTLAAPAPKKGDEPPARLEGDWLVESFEGGPDERPPGNLQFRFADGKVTVSDAGRPQGKADETTYTVDLTKKPATIDIKPGRGDKVVLGIVEIKGDTLKLCFGKDATERPTEFKPDAEKRIIVVHLKRINDGK